MPLLVGLKSSIAWRAHAIDTAPELALYGPDTSVRCPILSAVAARAEPITKGAASTVHPPVAPTNSSRRDMLFGRIINRPPCAFVAAQHLPVVDPVQTLPIAS